MHRNPDLIPAKRKHWHRQVWKRILQLYVIYFLIGLLLPPLFQKEAPDSIQIQPVHQATERVLFINDNSDALLWRLRMIESAQQEIVLATFDWRDDNSGRDMTAAVQGAADRGVNVRILVDGLSGTRYLRGSASFRALAAMPNVEIKLYNPVNPLKPWALNYRMHDKYLIVDNTAYLLGGRNTWDSFLGSYVDTYNLDRDVLVYTEIAGDMSSLSQLQTYFEKAWSQDCSKTMTARSANMAETHQAALRAQERALREHYPDAFSPFEWEAETLPANQVYLLSNSAEPWNKAPQLWQDLSSLMKHGTDIQVQTPYIICNQRMYETLEEICSNADSVQIMTNGVENGANPFGCADYLNQKKRILETGTAVVEWMGGQSLHTKTVLIDDRFCAIGSFNMDMRSVYLDTELMVVIDCPELNQALRADFKTMTEQSRTVSCDGSVTLGARFEALPTPVLKKCLYSLLRVVLWPIRYLL